MRGEESRVVDHVEHTRLLAMVHHVRRSPPVRDFHDAHCDAAPSAAPRLTRVRAPGPTGLPWRGWRQLLETRLDQRRWACDTARIDGAYFQPRACRIRLPNQALLFCLRPATANNAEFVVREL